jgi:hypothetical protein
MFGGAGLNVVCAALIKYIEPGMPFFPGIFGISYMICGGIACIFTLIGVICSIWKRITGVPDGAVTHVTFSSEWRYHTVGFTSMAIVIFIADIILLSSLGI